MGIFPFLHTITFSKDRPWQLSEHLRTYYKHNKIQGYYAKKHYVIFSASPENYSYYVDIMLNYPEVVFIPDNYSGANFHKILRMLLNDPYLNDDDSSVLFTVDDVLFYDDFGPEIRIAACGDRDDIISLRLHPFCYFCQPAGNRRNDMPMLQQEADHQSFTYVPGGFGDWYYPYEVSASIYRIDSPAWKKLMRVVNDPNAVIRHPNDLEARWSMTATDREKIVIGNKPCCCTVTVNRVQDDYKNPIGSTELTQSAARLLYETRRQYDTDHYKNAGYQSIHVTDLCLKGL
jgi:hypothetical protein